MKSHKKFLFGIISIICVSGVTAWLKYDGEIYLKLIGSIVGLFMVTQGVQDTLKEKNGGKDV